MVRDFLQTYGKEIFALLVPILTFALNRFFKSKAKLDWFEPHSFTYLTRNATRDEDGSETVNTLVIHTKTVVVRNSGRETATKVELVFNWKPMCINMWPPRHHDEHQDGDNRYSIIYDSLAPGEFVGCSLLSVSHELPNLVNVRSEQCVAQNVVMLPQPIVSGWLRVLLSTLLAVGSVATIYLAISLIQWLVLNTPL